MKATRFSLSSRTSRPRRSCAHRGRLRYRYVPLAVLLTLITLPGGRPCAAQLPAREERTNVIFSFGGYQAQVYDPATDGWNELQTSAPIVAVLTGNLRDDALAAEPNSRDAPDDQPLDNGVLVATERGVYFYDPTAKAWSEQEFPAGESFVRLAMPDRGGEVMGVALTGTSAYIYNGARNAWMGVQVPEGLDPNLTQIGPNNVLVANAQRALLYDRVADNWFEYRPPAGETILVTATPSTPEPGFTQLILTERSAITFDPVKDEFSAHQMPGRIRSFAIAENAIVVATENGVSTFDPVTDTWADQQLGTNVVIPQNGLLAARNTVMVVAEEGGLFYNRSRHEWQRLDAPANQTFAGCAIAENTGVYWTAEGRAFVYDANQQQFVEGAAPANATIVNGTMNQNLALLTTDQGAMVYDPGINQWVQVPLAAADFPNPPGAPQFSVSRFTTVLTTNTGAWVWNPTTHQFDGVSTGSRISAVSTSENAAVVGTDYGAMVYDPTLNQWVEVKPPSVNEPVLGVDTARNTIVARTEGRAWFYNRSTHEWSEVAAPANETWNIQMALENTALVCSERHAAVWDPTTDQWVMLQTGGDASVLRDGNSFLVVDGLKAFVYNRSRHEWEERDLPSGGTAQGGRRGPTACGQPQSGSEPADEDAVVDPGPADATSTGDLPTGPATTQVTRSVILILDSSGSMADNNKLDDAKAAAKELLRALAGQADTQVGLLIYYDCASIEWHDFTQDVSGLEAAVDAAEASGNTPLFMSIGIAYDHMEKSGSERGDIVVLTDGGETCQDDEARNREAAESFSTRRIPYLRRSPGPTSSAGPRGYRLAAVPPPGLAHAPARSQSSFRAWLDAVASFFGPQAAYAQEPPGTIKLHVVGFQVTPEDDARLRELASLAQGEYNPAADVSQLTQAVRTAAGVPAGRGVSPWLIVGIVAAVAVVGLVVWQTARRRRAPAVPAAPGGAVQLLVTRGQASPSSLRLTKPLISMGRDPKCDLRLNDPRASRQHALIRQQEGVAILFDLDSTNGTFVNGERISGPRALQPGDVIGLGSTEITFGSRPASPAPAAVGMLVITRGICQPAAIDLRSKPLILLGRDEACDGVIRDDPQVSRRHAQIRPTAQGPLIEDLGSRNGLFVNDQRVPGALLRPGDRVRLGITEFIYHV